MRPLVLADHFLTGSILSWLLPVGLLIAIAVWYAIGSPVRRVTDTGRDPARGRATRCRRAAG